MQMPVKYLDSQALIDERIRNKETRSANVVDETMTDVFREGYTPKPELVQNVQMSTPKWEGSAAHFDVWNKFHEMRSKLPRNKEALNAAQAPSAATIAGLLGQFFVDVTRRAMESPDLTDKITQEIVNANFPKSVTLEDFLPYRGEFRAISGTGNNVDLIELATGATDTVTLGIKALGWETTLENILFNPIHNLQKVSQAVADAYTDQRNANTVGRIVGATFVASQSQAVVEPPNSSYDVKMYQTLLAGLQTLMKLKDYMTGRQISTAPGIRLLCNSADRWAIERVVNGQLSQVTNGVFSSQNLSGLPISEILVYDQGITNGFSYKTKTLSFLGVTAGTCYVFVPSTYNWLLTKRGLTQEVGLANPLQTLKESRMWYFSDATYDKYFLGSSYAGSGWGAGYGSIVKITLPDAGDNT
jgi:hypothetical protein